MTAIGTTTKYSSLGIFVLTSLAGTLFLFYIDEGNYNLDNLFLTGNLIALSFYLVGIYVVTSLLYFIFAKYLSYSRSTLLAIAIGFPIGTIFTALVLTGVRLLLMNA